MKEDILSTGVSESMAYIERLRKATLQVVKDITNDFTTKGVEVVNDFASQLVYSQEDVEGHEAQDNVGIIHQLGATSVAEIRNDNPIAVFIEFGTGRVGETNPHPHPELANWEYYVQTIYKKTDKYGQEGWWHSGEFMLGLTSMPFMYSAGNEIERLMSGWIKSNLERNMSLK